MTQSSHKLREQHWLSVIQQCNQEIKSEGITKREWMKRNNVNYHSFYRWQQKLRNAVACELLVVQAQQNAPAIVEKPMQKFAELTNTGMSSIKNHDSKTVLKCRNISVELNEDISDQLLLRLIRVLTYVES